ncbi:mitochondrial amidoxime reducing component 2 isoform X2 [Pongo abelii]|uniref:mitochondrial amidoxime reducing component 2 isoform X2 n=1 Tax=Pongo abelii TaxID=9601 RepID=UPI0023E8B736|nr:mitochondrial amidoxime reducing component 2 isoform X2 [Pongo abelii]
MGNCRVVGAGKREETLTTPEAAPLARLLWVASLPRRPGYPGRSLPVFLRYRAGLVTALRHSRSPRNRSATLAVKGFWLVIKEDGHMVTARQEPRLVLVSITYENNCLIFRAPDMDQLVLPSKQPSSNKLHNCRIFGLDIKGRDCGNEAAKWFTNFLKTEAYRLVQFETNMKGRTSRKLVPTLDQNYQVAYPDCCPLLIMTDASLVDLNTRMEKKMKMENFRPNIVVTGCDAFEEDTWDELLIGSVEVKKVMACPRCILTTVDPDAGVIDRKEPLDTLKSYRLCDPSERQLYKLSPLFGIYYSVEKIGSLRVGDPVYRMV